MNNKNNNKKLSHKTTINPEATKADIEKLNKTTPQRYKVDLAALQMRQNFSLVSDAVQRMIYDRLLINMTANPAAWYQSQMLLIKRSQKEFKELIPAYYKQLVEKQEKTAKSLVITSNQVNIDNKIYQSSLTKVMESATKTYQEIVNNVYTKAKLQEQQQAMQPLPPNPQVIKTDYYSKAAIPLQKMISDGILNAAKRGAVIYADGKNYRYEDYMEMKVRSELQRETTTGLIASGQNLGVVFYISSSYGDCAPDHAEMQEKGIFYDEDYADIAPDRAQEIEDYINEHHLVSTEYAMNENGNYFCMRPNCRHYLQAISIDEVLGIKSKDDLKEFRSENHLIKGGSYEPEKYQAMQEQRQNERYIRHYKRENEAAESLLKNGNLTQQQQMELTATIFQNNRRIMSAQANIRNLIKHNSFLVREPKREKANYTRSDFKLHKTFK